MYPTTLDDVLAKPDDMNDDLSKTIKNLEVGDSSPQASSSGEKLLSESLEKTAEELMQHRKRKHSNKLVQERVISVSLDRLGIIIGIF